MKPAAAHILFSMADEGLVQADIRPCCPLDFSPPNAGVFLSLHGRTRRISEKAAAVGVVRPRVGIDLRQESARQCDIDLLGLAFVARYVDFDGAAARAGDPATPPS